MGMHRVEDPADPNRCKGSVPDGQCVNRAEEGSEYCLAYDGVDRAPASRMRQYLLARVEDQRRFAQLSEAEDIKSLREDVSLAVMMLERRWNLAKTRHGLHCRQPAVGQDAPDGRAAQKIAADC